MNTSTLGIRARLVDHFPQLARAALLFALGACFGVAAILLSGCGHELEQLELDAGDVDGPDLGEPSQGDAGELPAPSLELDCAADEHDAGAREQSDDAGAPAELGLYPALFSWPYARCEGHWVDPSDSSTRLVAHPDTGLCTFSCVWLEPKCHESWYADPRCFPAHAAVLGQLCAELGGSCELDAAKSTRYCVGELR